MMIVHACRGRWLILRIIIIWHIKRFLKWYSWQMYLLWILNSKKLISISHNWKTGTHILACTYLCVNVFVKHRQPTAVGIHCSYHIELNIIFFHKIAHIFILTSSTIFIYLWWRNHRMSGSRILTLHVLGTCLFYNQW